MKQKHFYGIKALSLALMLGFGASVLPGCKNYTDDINGLTKRIENLEEGVSSLKKLVGEGRFVTNITTTPTGLQVTFNGGQTVDVKIQDLVKNSIDAKVDAAGDLYVNGKKVGHVTGKDGKDGKDGINGKDGKDGKDGINGKDGKDGKDGINGKDGKDGKDGKSITAVDLKFSMSADGELIVTDPAGNVLKTGVFIPKAASFVINSDGRYVLTMWNPDTKKYEQIVLPKGEMKLTGLNYVPHTNTVLGDTKQIVFPVIVTDSVKLANGFRTIKGGDFSDDKMGLTPDNYKGWDWVYSGKANLQFALNPRNVDPAAFQLLGMVTNHKAKVGDKYDDSTASHSDEWDTYSQNDDDCMLFNQDEAFYTGKFDNAKNIDENGRMNIRAKAWALAERSNKMWRTYVSLVVKSDDHKLGSEYVAARRKAIMQKNLFITSTAYTTFNHAAPTDFAFWNTYNVLKKDGTVFGTVTRDTDPYFMHPQNENDGKLHEGKTVAERAAIDARAENLLYKALTPKYELPLGTKEKPGTLDLKKMIRAYYFPSNSQGFTDGTKHVLIADNGEPVKGNAFDDFKLEFELVDFYNEGVNQTLRYIDPEKSKDGMITIRNFSLIEQNGELHTAAIGRTPMVRVKMLAPVEDNYEVVKTALIKLVIVNKVIVPDVTRNWTVDFILHANNQEQILDMDRIFNEDGVQLSKKEFKDNYDFDGYTLHKVTYKHAKNFTPVHKFDLLPFMYANQVRVNDIAIGMTGKANTLVAYISPLAFEGTYTYKTKYVKKATSPLGAAPKNVFINVTINVKYPTVKAPEKTPLNWVADQIVSTGRIVSAATRPAAGETSYEMVQDLNTSFDLTKYENNPTELYSTAFKGAYGATFEKNAARPVFSFEMAKEDNMISYWPMVSSGIKLFKKNGAPRHAHWELGLEPTEAGRKHITPMVYDKATKKFVPKNKKIIKFNSVISFNEWIDGNYGNYGAGRVKFAKNTAYGFVNTDIFLPVMTGVDYTIKPFDNIGGKSKYDEVKVPYAIPAPQYGRSVVMATYETYFPNPMRFYQVKEGELYDKYQDAHGENKYSLSRNFVLTDYLFTDGQLTANKPHHIIYNFNYAGTTVEGITYDADGWYDDYREQFEALKFNGTTFKIGRVYYKSTGATVDAVNAARFLIKYDPIKKEYYLTWDNAGADIVQDVVCEVEVNVIHKWGEEEEGSALVYDAGTRGKSTFIMPIVLHPHK